VPYVCNGNYDTRKEKLFPPVKKNAGSAKGGFPSTINGYLLYVGRLAMDLAPLRFYFLPFLFDHYSDYNNGLSEILHPAFISDAEC
jgi:hypothetical protein